jgi:hypothetical protein
MYNILTSYSIDLKNLDFIEQGNTRKEAANFFELSVATMVKAI